MWPSLYCVLSDQLIQTGLLSSRSDLEDIVCIAVFTHGRCLCSTRRLASLGDTTQFALSLSVSRGTQHAGCFEISKQSPFKSRCLPLSKTPLHPAYPIPLGRQNTLKELGRRLSPNVIQFTMADSPFRADFKSSSFLAEQYLSSITRSTFSASNANRPRTLLMTRVGLKQIPRQMKISMCGSLKTGNLESYSKKQLLSILHVCSQIKRMHTTQQLVCYEGLLHK